MKSMGRVFIKHTQTTNKSVLTRWHWIMISIVVKHNIVGKISKHSSINLVDSRPELWVYYFLPHKQTADMQ